jgi:hypothetical protein
VLGVILFFVGGMELASSTEGDGDRADRVVQAVTGGRALAALEGWCRGIGT